MSNEAYMSLDCMDLVTKLSLPASLGGGNAKGETELRGDVAGSGSE